MSKITRKIENSDKFRSNIRLKLNEILENEKNSNNLEKGIFNYALNESKNRKVVKKWDNPYFVQIYLDRLRSIFTNLTNKNLLEQLNSGAIKAHSIAFMTHQEMSPEKWDALITAKAKEIKTNLKLIWRLQLTLLHAENANRKSVRTTHCKHDQVMNQ